MSFDDLRDFLDEKLEQSPFNLGDSQALIVVAVVVLLVAGGFVYYLRTKPSSIRQDYYSTKTERPALKGAKTKPKKTLIVHVCGAVKNPGVLELKEGDRVIDAIALGGGATEEANPDSLNLAAKLIDGQKIYVPKKGEQVSAAMTGSAAGGSSPEVAAAPININVATAQELDSLPGVGEVLAQRIIEYRESKGSYKSIGDLRNVEGIGPKKFEHLKDKVTIN